MASITLLFVGLGVGFAFGWIGSEFWFKRAIKKAFNNNIAFYTANGPVTFDEVRKWGNIKSD